MLLSRDYNGIKSLSCRTVVDRAEVDVSILRARSFIYCIGCLEITMNRFKIILK